MSKINIEINSKHTTKKKFDNQLNIKKCNIYSTDYGYRAGATYVTRYGTFLYYSTGGVMSIFKDGYSTGGVMYIFKDGTWQHLSKENLDGPYLKYISPTSIFKNRLHRLFEISPKCTSIQFCKPSSLDRDMQFCKPSSSESDRQFSKPPSVEADMQFSNSSSGDHCAVVCEFFCEILGSSR